MAAEPEVFSASDFLREQIRTNKEQLAELQRIAGAEQLRRIFWLQVVILLAAAILAVGYLFVLDPARVPIRREFQDLSGAVLVFLIFGLIHGIRALVSANARRSEIDRLSWMQRDALNYADQILTVDHVKERRTHE